MPRYFEFKPPEKKVTEIRVHGVGGTPPEAMLDDPHPVQVTGDDHAGFFRKNTTDEERDVEAYSWGGLTSRGKARSLWLLLLPFSLVNAGGWMVESDTTKKRGERQIHAEIQERTVRVIGALTTLALIAWIAALFVDLIAFQCGGNPACREGHWWLEWIGDKQPLAEHPGLLVALGLVVPLLVFFGIDRLAERVRTNYDEYPVAGDRREAGDMADLTDRNFWNRPTLVHDLALFHRACVLLALASAFAYTLAAFDGESRWSGLYLVSAVLALGAIVAALGPAALRPRRTRHDENLRRANVPIALTILGVVSLAYLVFHASTTEPGALELGFSGELALPEDAPALAAFRRLPFFVLGAQLVLIVLGVVGPQFVWWLRKGNMTPGTGTRQGDRVARRWAILLLVASLAMLVWPAWWLLVVVLLGAIVATARSAAVQGIPLKTYLPRKAGWALLALVIGVPAICWTFGNETPALVSLAAVTVIVAVRATQETWRADAFRWGGIAVTPLFGVFLLAGTFTGVALRLRDFLDKDEETAIDLALPSAYAWFAIAFGSALALTALAAFVVHRRSVRVVSELGPAQLPDPDFDDSRAPLPERKLREARAAMRKSIALVRTARDGDILVTVLCTLTVLGSGIGMRAALTGDSDEVGWNRLFGGENFPEVFQWGWLRTSSSWVLAGLPVLIVLAFRRSMQSEAMRRRIGIAWDLLTFWPRRFHPFAPPSYAERAVPELQQRIAEAREAKGGTGSVALLGHSQGSIVSIAAVASLEPKDLSRVAVATYGSPLATFYRRFFPSYFTNDLFDHVGKNLREASGVRPLWRNFYRWTDPIGGPVFTKRYNDPPYGRPAADPANDDPTRGDVHLHDPWWWWDSPGQPEPRPLGHSDYLADAAMREWTEALWNAEGSS